MEANALAGTDTIRIPNAGTYSLTLAGTDDVAAVGDLDITENVVVIGSVGVVIDASALGDRIFDIRGAYTARLTAVTLNYGGGNTTTYGGAIYSNGGTVGIKNVMIQYGSATYGGGLFMNGGSVEISGSTTFTFTSNTASSCGGAVYNSGGTFMATSMVATSPWMPPINTGIHPVPVFWTLNLMF